MVRRPFVAVLIAAFVVLGVATAAHAADYGPGWSGDQWSSPTYSLPIRVVDTVTLTLPYGSGERRIYRDERNQALDLWGIPFYVDEEPESVLVHVFDGSAIEDMILPDAILLVRNRTGAYQDVGGWVPEAGGGIAVVSPTAEWWEGYFFRCAQGAIGHEIGHALGFAHGGTGIMVGRNQPNAEDVALAQGFYL